MKNLTKSSLRPILIEGLKKSNLLYTCEDIADKVLGLIPDELPENLIPPSNISILCTQDEWVKVKPILEMWGLEWFGIGTLNFWPGNEVSILVNLDVDKGLTWDFPNEATPFTEITALDFLAKYSPSEDPEPKQISKKEVLESKWLPELLVSYAASYKHLAPFIADEIAKLSEPEFSFTTVDGRVITDPKERVWYEEGMGPVWIYASETSIHPRLAPYFSTKELAQASANTTKDESK